MRTTLALLTLLLISVLALVAPTDCGCPLDPHNGQALHPLFEHVHPDSQQTGSADQPVLARGDHQPALRNSLAYGPAGSSVLSGIALPSAELPIDQERFWRPLLVVSTGPQPSTPTGPPDPPPNLA